MKLARIIIVIIILIHLHGFFFKVRYAKVPQQFAPSQSPREVAVHDSGNEISVVNTLQYLLGPRLLKVKSKHHFEVERLLIS